MKRTKRQRNKKEIKRDREKENGSGNKRELNRKSRKVTKCKKEKQNATTEE